MNADRLLALLGLGLSVLAAIMPEIDKALCVTLAILSVAMAFILGSSLARSSPGLFDPIRYACIVWIAVICTQQLLTVTIRRDGARFATEAAAELVDNWTGGRRTDVKIFEMDGNGQLAAPGSYVVQVRPTTRAMGMQLEPVVALAVDTRSQDLEDKLAVLGAIIIFLTVTFYGIIVISQAYRNPPAT